MEASANGRLVFCTEDSDWMLELALDEACELLNRTSCLVLYFQHVDTMHSGKIVQEMQDPMVTVVPPCELLQVKMDASKRL
jgi:hypothetical protein